MASEAADRRGCGVDLSLSDDQRAIREAFADVFAKESPVSIARAAEPLGFDRTLWERLIATGVTGMAASEPEGGGGASLSDLVVVAEELGRVIAPVPLVEHWVASRLHPLDDILSGEVVAALALRPADADGVWRLVPGGAVADVVVGVDGDDVIAVRSAPLGRAPRNHACAPLADRSSRPDGDATHGRTVIAPAPAFGPALDEWRTLTAATLVGVADAALAIGVEYVKTRKQFGVPIASFQAVQHGMADLPILVEGARLLTHKAAWAGDRARAGITGAIDVDDNEIDDFATLAGMALVFAGQAAAHATDRSLHFHGGYGYAEEYDIQMFYRRARGWALVLDDPSNECLRLADGLFGPVASAGDGSAGRGS
jgi:alkylation response protein AidB-like acyl-CoA dehydrogenase